jgi:hypothetical protein
MLNRWTGLTLVAGLMAGYYFAPPGAVAQTDPMPFSIGDRVTLRYEVSAEDRFQDVTCLVGAFQGDWVRCDSTDRFKTPNSETWRSLRQVVQITKYMK